MGWPDFPPGTDMDLAHHKLDHMKERQDKLVEATNNLGKNMQWIIDNVQGIFQMFQSPQFMQALPSMMNPKAMQAAASEMKKDDDGSEPTAE